MKEMKQLNAAPQGSIHSFTDLFLLKLKDKILLNGFPPAAETTFEEDDDEAELHDRKLTCCDTFKRTNCNIHSGGRPVFT